MTRQSPSPAISNNLPSSYGSVNLPASDTSRSYELARTATMSTCLSMHKQLYLPQTLILPEGMLQCGK
jgi:hypothetical protein